MTPDCDSLSAALARIAPVGTAVAAVPIMGPPPPLWPVERDAMQGAVPSRLLEFACGRAAARRALAQLGCGARPLPQLPSRAPLWPEGYVGAIAHAGGMAVAVAGWAAHWSGLGVDLEPVGSVDADLADSILRPDEEDAEQRAPRGMTEIFCAKEAAFKAISAASGTLLEFRDLHLRRDTEGEFEIVLCRAAGPLPPQMTLRGRWTIASGYQLALVPWARELANSAPSFAASRLTS